MKEAFVVEISHTVTTSRGDALKWPMFFSSGVDLHKCQFARDEKYAVRFSTEQEAREVAAEIALAGCRCGREVEKIHVAWEKRGIMGMLP